MKTQRLDPKKELSRQDGEFSFQDKTNSRSIAGKHTGNRFILLTRNFLLSF